MFHIRRMPLTHPTPPPEFLQREYLCPKTNREAEIERWNRLAEEFFYFIFMVCVEYENREQCWESFAGAQRLPFGTRLGLARNSRFERTDIPRDLLRLAAFHHFQVIARLQVQPERR